MSSTTSGRRAYFAAIEAAHATRGIKAKRSRTPHLDRLLEKRRLKGPERNKPKRGIPERRAHAKAVAIARLTRKISRGSRGEALPDAHRTDGPHHHTCVTPACLRRYRCENVCDPIDEGLRNSICPKCFDDALSEICA